MQKAKLIQQIVASLSESLALLERAARASHAEATPESSKAESKSKTRGLEAAYLAGGQASGTICLDPEKKRINSERLFSHRSHGLAALVLSNTRSL